MFQIWDILIYSYRGEKKKEGSSHILEKWKKLMPLVAPSPPTQTIKTIGRYYTDHKHFWEPVFKYFSIVHTLQNMKVNTRDIVLGF